jgi:hypothetical protein
MISPFIPPPPLHFIFSPQNLMVSGEKSETITRLSIPDIGTETPAPSNQSTKKSFQFWTRFFPWFPTEQFYSGFESLHKKRTDSDGPIECGH